MCACVLHAGLSKKASPSLFLFIDGETLYFRSHRQQLHWLSSSIQQMQPISFYLCNSRTRWKLQPLFGSLITSLLSGPIQSAGLDL